jgi:hypothetical protein
MEQNGNIPGIRGWINLERGLSEVVTAEVNSLTPDEDWQLLSAFLGWIDRREYPIPIDKHELAPLLLQGGPRGALSRGEHDQEGLHSAADKGTCALLGHCAADDDHCRRYLRVERHRCRLLQCCKQSNAVWRQ